MTSQNPAEKNAKALATPQDDAAPNAAEPSEIKRKLTDEEIAAVAGGTSTSVTATGHEKWIEVSSVAFR